MKRVIAYTLLAFAALVALGQTSADTTKVYYRINRGVFNPAYDENRGATDSLIEKIRAAASAHNLSHVDIHSYASPDGPVELNERLAALRGNTLKNYIVEHTGIDGACVRTTSGGIAWDELHRLVAGNAGVPSQAKILSVLDDTTLVAKSRGGANPADIRKQRLQSIGNGQPYRWLLSHIFPRLRYAVAITVYLNDGDDKFAERPAVMPDATLFINSLEIFNEEPTLKDFVELPLSAYPKHEPYHRLALKTNLLYYPILLPNLELEWLINDRWSAAIEGDVAWWGKYSENKSYRLAVISAEGRHWIKPRAPWHGFFVGAFAGGGWYDFLKDTKGYYGEGGMAGVSAGYMWPIGRNLSFEGSIGAGYMYTRIKEYTPYEGHHLYQRTKQLNYFGPLKLKLSIVWRFLDRNRYKSKRIIRLDEE